MRLRYKSLYLLQVQIVKEQRERAEHAEHELKRLREVLASAGDRLLRGCSREGIGYVEADGLVNEYAIFLPPVAFECAKACMDSRTWFSTCAEWGAVANYEWQGRRIIELP